MKIEFTKMHGAGNDYVYVDCLNHMPANVPEIARRISDRHYGVGADGRVKIPTIYLSLSRLYPLGERKDTVKISKINKNNNKKEK